MKKRWQSIAAMIERTATAKGRASSGYFSIEGTRLHERALRSNVLPTAVLVTQFIWQNPPEREAAVLQQLAPKNIPCHPIPDEAMTRLTEGRELGGLLGLVPLPEQPNLANWLAANPAPTMLVAVSVVDPGNVGGMVRTAHALGAGLFVSLGSSDPLHPRAVRTSMGSIFKQPIVTTTVNLLFEALRPYAVQTVGAVAENGIALPNFQVSGGGTAVFLGNEYEGLPDELLSRLAQRVTIPMTVGIDSFSVNAAAAIVLYELQRQRAKSP